MDHFGTAMREVADKIDEFKRVYQGPQTNPSFSRENLPPYKGALETGADLGSKRSQILKAAISAVDGDRQDVYGPPEENFERIAQLWNSMGFRIVNKGTQNILPTDVAIAMALVKIARLKNTPGHEDSWVDLAGYAAIGGEVSQKEADQPAFIKENKKAYEDEMQGYDVMLNLLPEHPNEEL